ncbi:MAG: serine protease [Oscillospiraceae bacterium]|nr:serine protease [Oscillospiraceae bacterium]
MDYNYNGENPVQNNIPEEKPHKDYFEQESFYQKYPLPRDMNNPYAEPKFAEFVPQNLETTGGKKRRSGIVALSVISACVVGIFVFLFAFLSVNDSFASIYEKPEESISESEDDEKIEEDEDKAPDVKDDKDDKDDNGKGYGDDIYGFEFKDELQQPDPDATSDKHDISNSEKPDSYNRYYNANGTFTSEGVYREIVPSVVSIRASLSKDGSRQSAGSGVILTNDGYIVTNEHVITGAYVIKAMTTDGEVYDLALVGKDTKTDLAVLKMITDKKDFVPAQLGNSDDIIIGERVYAIGYSGGVFSNTFTGGYVSGLNRTLQLNQNSYEMNYIQTDASVNPGNSGGPLVNEYAQVIGINNFKYTGINSDLENLTFAISINEAIPVINDIIKTGYVTGRPRVGITYTPVSPQVSSQSGRIAGLYIADVAEDCDIASKDIQPGDIIIKVNGKDVYSSQTVMDALEGYKPNDVATAEVVRYDEEGNKSTHTISFRLGELKE